MKEAIIHPGPKVEIIDSPVPKARADQVVIKVIYSGSNPKDWKYPEWTGKIFNQGDDIAGYVHEVGQHVTEFTVGDRVVAFHEMLGPHGSYAEYAVAPAHTTAHLPENISFEEAATIPLAALTAANGLYKELGLPPPFRPATESVPLLIYGGASAVGAYAIQFAQRSNIHPIITVAGRGIPFVEQYLDKSKGDVAIDYRQGNEALINGIKSALKGQKLEYAFDTISENESYENIYKVLEPNGRIDLVLPAKQGTEVPNNIRQTMTNVGSVHTEARDHGLVYFRLIAQGLKEGWFKPHPHQVIPGGLDGIQQALTDLKAGKASAVKYIFKIADTSGIK